MVQGEFDIVIHVFGGAWTRIGDADVSGAVTVRSANMIMVRGRWTVGLIVRALWSPLFGAMRKRGIPAGLDAQI